jgi:hypothetical protein
MQAGAEKMSKIAIEGWARTAAQTQGEDALYHQDDSSGPTTLREAAKPSWQH